MKRAGLIAAVVVLVVAAGVVDVFLPHHRRDLASVGALENPLVFVVSSSIVEELEKPQLDALSKSLSSALDLTVVVRISRTPADGVATFADDGADIGLLTLGEYLVARERHHVEPLFKVRHRGGDDGNAASEIDVRADSELKKLTDLNGKKVAVVDRHSVTRFVLAAAELAPEHVTWVDATAYSESMRMLADGSVDAAVAFAGASRSDKTIRALATTPSVPNEPVFVRASMSPELRQKVERGLKALTEDALQRIGDVRALDPIDDRAYDGARKMVAQAGLTSAELVRVAAAP